MPKTIETFFEEIVNFSKSKSLHNIDLSDEEITKIAKPTLMSAKAIVAGYEGNLDEISTEFGLTALQFSLLFGNASAIAVALILKGSNPDQNGSLGVTTESIIIKERRCPEMMELIEEAKRFDRKDPDAERREAILLSLGSLGEKVIAEEGKKEANRMRDTLGMVPRMATATRMIPMEIDAEAKR